MNNLEQKRANEQKRVLIRNLFSPDQDMREQARDELKKAWNVDQPSFRVDELAAHPAENASLMAAIREGNREVIEWILGL